MTKPSKRWCMIKFRLPSLCLCALFLSFSVSAQNQPYLFSHQIESLLQTDSTQWKFQTASWNYSFVGDYAKAMETKDRQFPNAKAPVPTQDHIDNFKKYYPVNAREAILKEAAKTRILIVNEAHHMALHRIFLADLLKDLHALGYTFIGMETLAHEDTLLNRRGYPTLNSGFYVKEPCFGNLIREALDRGFTVFPYEQIHEDSLQNMVGREKAQAINIKKVMDRHPEGKFILYCGYDHAAEDTLKNFMGLPMAGQIKNLTGIDPFTIDQTALSEYFKVGNRYRPLMNEKTDVLFADSNGRYFNRASYPKAMDCNLYHPNTTYIGQRPSWLLRENTRLVTFHHKVKLEPPYLVKIYLHGENPELAIPIDVVEILSAQDRKASVVYKRRKHVAHIENSKGEKQEIRLRRFRMKSV